MTKIKTYFLYFLFLTLWLAEPKLLKTDVLAQITSSGVAISAPVAESGVKDASVICTYPEGNVACKKSYDSSMFGVISDNPAAAIEDFELANSRLVISSGLTQVRVSSINGNIEEGNFLTSSETPGVAQRGTRNGYVLGMAMENYTSNDQSSVGTIQVMVNIHPTTTFSGTRGNLLQFIRQGLAVPIFEPLESLRYILAALMVIISFTLGLIYFGRATRTGIEAIGRNPLAKGVIQFTVFLNITLTIVIVLVGLGIAWLILIL